MNTLQKKMFSIKMHERRCRNMKTPKRLVNKFRMVLTLEINKDQYHFHITLHKYSFLTFFSLNSSVGIYVVKIVVKIGKEKGPKC